MEKKTNAPTTNVMQVSVMPAQRSFLAAMESVRKILTVHPVRTCVVNQFAGRTTLVDLLLSSVNVVNSVTLPRVLLLSVNLPPENVKLVPFLMERIVLLILMMLVSKLVNVTWEVVWLWILFSVLLPMTTDALRMMCVLLLVNVLEPLWTVLKPPTLVCN